MRLAIIVGLCLSLMFDAVAADSYRIDNGASAEITEHGQCRAITNTHTSGSAIFIPTRTPAEWTSFIGSPIPGVTVAACGPACGGEFVGGYCWYIGSQGASCDTTCSGHGGCNLTGTRNYVGSGGTRANCNAVTGTFAPGATNGSDNTQTSWGGIGCTSVFSSMLGTTSSIRYTGVTTSCGASISSRQRVCACNN